MTWSSAGATADRRPPAIVISMLAANLQQLLVGYSFLPLLMTIMGVLSGPQGVSSFAETPLLVTTHSDVILDIPSDYTVLQGSIDVNYNITRFALPIKPHLHNRGVLAENSFSNSTGKFSLCLIELVGNNAELLVTEMPLYPKTPVGTAVFPCGTISHAGRYIFKLILQNGASNGGKLANEVARSRLMAATWPDISFKLPSLVDSYSTGANVTVALTRTQCEPFSAFRLRSEFRIRALATNRTSARVDVTSLFKTIERVVYVPCHAFGHAGLYRAEIWMVTPTGSETLAANSRDFDVSWGKGFKLKLFSTSAFPCSGAGVLLAYETPSCTIEGTNIEDSNDVESRRLYVDNRIRVYGRVKVANVTAAMAPTRLVYMGEKNVRGVPGGSVAFDCAWFNEDFVEYCFVITNVDEQGAVADVVKECVPTYPPAVIRHGGWSSWRPWSDCDAKCGYGHRNRIRLCDSPYPTYGGRYCQGSPLEDAVCERSPCLLPFEKPGSPRTITPFAECQCGCNVSLVGDGGGIDLFVNIRNCLDSQLTWLIETKPGSKLVANLKFLQLDEPVQIFTLRDGAGSKDELLLRASLIVHPVTFQSTGRFILFRIETKYRRPFFAFSGFLARIRSIAERPTSSEEDTSSSSWPTPGSWLHLVFHFIFTHQAQLAIVLTLAVVCCAVTSMASYAAAVSRCCPNYHQRKFSQISFSSSSRRESLRPLREEDDEDDEEGYAKLRIGRRRGRRRDEEDGPHHSTNNNRLSAESSSHIYHEIGPNEPQTSERKQNGCLPRLLLRKTFFNRGINNRTRLRESLSLVDYEVIFGPCSNKRCTKVHSKAADWINCPECSTRQQHSLPGSPCLGRKGLGNCKHNSARRCFSKGFSWPPGLRMRGRNQLGGRKSSSVQCIDVEERVELSAFREMFPSRFAICGGSRGNLEVPTTNGLTRSETRDGNVTTPQQHSDSHIEVITADVEKPQQRLNSPTHTSRITAADIDALRAESASSLAGSCNHGEELELDYYDYDVFNACAVPGSMFNDASVMDWLPSFAGVDPPSDSEDQEIPETTPGLTELSDLTPTNESYPMDVLNNLSIAAAKIKASAEAASRSASSSDSDGDAEGLLSRFKIMNSEPPIAFVDEEDIMEEDDL